MDQVSPLNPVENVPLKQVGVCDRVPLTSQQTDGLRVLHQTASGIEKVPPEIWLNIADCLVKEFRGLEERTVMAGERPRYTSPMWMRLPLKPAAKPIIPLSRTNRYFHSLLSPPSQFFTRLRLPFSPRDSDAATKVQLETIMSESFAPNDGLIEELWVETHTLHSGSRLAQSGLEQILFRICRVRSLHLENIPINATLHDAIFALPLERLEVRRCGIVEDFQESTAQPPVLRYLQVSSHLGWGPRAAAWLQAILSPTTLEYLNVDSPLLLDTWPTLPNLKELVVDKKRSRDPADFIGAATLGHPLFRSIPNLQRIWIGLATRVDADVPRPMLASLRSVSVPVQGIRWFVGARPVNEVEVLRETSWDGTEAQWLGLTAIIHHSTLPIKSLIATRLPAPPVVSVVSRIVKNFPALEHLAITVNLFQVGPPCYSSLPKTDAVSL